MQKLCQRKPSLSRLLKMKRHAPPFPLIFVIYCVCTARVTSGFPQPFDDYLGESDIPKSKICRSVMDLCNSMFNGMQIDEENNQEIYKRFLFHYSRAQDPTYPLKTGSFPVHPLMSLAPKLSERRMKRFLDPESQLAAEEFGKKDSMDTLGRPFFLFRPRNGRTVDNGGE
ncbi:neuromedin-S isoform X3 [Podarcis raffonei]|uniref:neuromedin-S isoform X3 n=1 Tax=Podarcis raffonei TaxID=65483 RepID=UPI00232932AA|nr:neuromedin-S isoform X3 [Podarcis raffonei]